MRDMNCLDLVAIIQPPGLGHQGGGNFLDADIEKCGGDRREESDLRIAVQDQLQFIGHPDMLAHNGHEHAGGRHILKDGYPIRTLSLSPERAHAVKSEHLHLNAGVGKNAARTKDPFWA